jgi:hypothetical protein
LLSLVIPALMLRIKLLPAVSTVRRMDDAGVDALVAATGAIAKDMMALPQGNAGRQLCPLVLRHAWPPLKALLRDPARRRQVVAHHGLCLMGSALEALLEPQHSWYCRCSCALDAAQVLLDVLRDAAPEDAAPEDAAPPTRCAWRRGWSAWTSTVGSFTCMACMQALDPDAVRARQCKTQGTRPPSPT